MSSASETPAIAPDEGASTTRPTATNPHVRLAIFVLLALIVPAAAVWATHASSDLILIDIVVLTTILREARTRVVRGVALLSTAVVCVLVGQFEIEAWLDAALVIATSFGFVWALRSWRFPVASDDTPARRFGEASIRLAAVALLVAAVEAFLEASVLGIENPVGAEFVASLVPMAVAAVVVAALAGRSILERVPASRSTKLAGPFVALAIALIAVQAATLYWQSQESAALDNAASTAEASFQRVVASTLQAFSARAGVAPRTPVVDDASFSRSVRAYMYGSPAVSAVALGLRQPNGTFTVPFVNDRAGTDEAIAPIMGGAPEDAQVLSSSLDANVTFILGVRDVPGSNLNPEPAVVWVAPWTSSAGAASNQVLTTAASLPVMFESAVSTLGILRESVHLDLVKGVYNGSPAATISSLGTPAKNDGPSSTGNLLLGDIPFEIIATPSDDFGTPLLVRGLVVGGLLLLGFVAAALMLQAANSRYRARRLIEERESLLAAAIDAAPGTVILIDEAQRVLMSNGDDDEKHQRMGRLIGDALPFTLNGLDGQRVRDLIAQAADGESGSVEYVDTLSAPTPVIFLVTVNPVKGETRGGAAAVVQVEDVTEDRARSVAAAQSERLRSLGTMAGGLAHDFNNLLFIISGYLQMLHDDDVVADDDNLTRYVERASDAAERGAEIASSLLSVARSQPLEATAIEVGSFLRRMWPLVKQAVGSGRAAELVVGDGPLDVLVDSGQLSGSLLNLVINARDAMEPGGTVTVSVSRQFINDPLVNLPEHDYVVIDVTDDGVGMTPETAQRAFEPYFSTKGVGHGTGIGLAAVYSFAQQSGGLARIASEKDVGTTVSIYLPTVFADQGTTSVALPSDVSGATRILVVDDESALAGLIAGWLTEQGAEVRVADNPAQAVRLAVDFQPEVLLTDVRLGDPSGVDGPELAEQIRSALPGLSVVFMTGFSDRMDELAERGAHTLAKPFTREALTKVLFPSEPARDQVGEVRGV